MYRSCVLGISVIAAVELGMLASGAIAQQKSVKDQLVGTWTLLLDDGIKADGTHAPAFGPNPMGRLIFTPDGHYSLAIARSGRAPFESNNRNTATADENKAAVQGTLFHFGTYTVDESNKSFTFRIEGSSFPNWEGTRQKRPVSAITDEVLTYNNAASTNPAEGAIRVELAWKRAKPETVAAANVTASAADVSSERLKFAAGVARAPAYEVPATTYVVSNPSRIFSDHLFYGTKVTGELKRGDRVEALAKVKGYDWILVGKGGVGIGYVAISMLSPADKYIP